MDFLKRFLKDEKNKYIKEFFKTGNKELLKKIKDIDEFLYVNAKVNGGI
jgi:hypothetical protein